MIRSIEKMLLKWMKEPRRKVLLIRGARQVGKTFSTRILGKNFKYFVEVNFEEDPDIKMFFEHSLNPLKICEKLSLYYNKPIKPKETLLFFDEIQACPNAIKALRYFYEKMPELHLIAAGSLLEFAISEIPSFGVGRIKSIYMYPMTFIEFLLARGEKKIVDLIQEASPENPIDQVIHNRLLDQVKIFQIIGGMPEVVKTYIVENDILKCQEIIDTVLEGYIDDFAKYKKRTPVNRLREVFASSVNQSGKKFKYNQIGKDHTNAYKDALNLLEKAGLIYKIFHTSARGIPLGAQKKPNKFKIIVMDSGLYQRSLGLDLADIISSNFPDLINRGQLAELFAGVELVAYQFQNRRPALYYWHREAKSSNAEVDYVVSLNEKIIPLEIKAGTRGQMQSMHLFLKERQLDCGVRISHENFTSFDNILTVPIYAISRLVHRPIM